MVVGEVPIGRLADGVTTAGSPDGVTIGANVNGVSLTLGLAMEANL